MTPDSFYDGGATYTAQAIVNAAKQALEAGATILDIGGCSTRPNSVAVSAEEEWQRLDTALGAIRYAFPDAILSVDTFRSALAQRAVEAYGVQIINDVQGEDGGLLTANCNVPYVLTHNQPLADKHTLTDMITFFAKRIDALQAKGVKDIILDPGFGFGKTVEENYAVLRNLTYLQVLELPILVGVSRKSMIYKPLGITPQEALNGTTALHMLALQGGAKILRVHDVKEAVETIKLYNLCHSM